MTLLLGQVLDPQGIPVPEAAIYVLSAPVSMPDIAQLSDEQGKFVLAAPAPGRYRLGVRSDRWGAAQADVVVGGEETLPVIVQFSSAKE